MAFEARIDNCVLCSEEFLRTGTRHLYCSDKCKEVAKYGKQRTCLHCGTILRSEQPKYCSTNCKYSHTLKDFGEKVPCDACGNPFHKRRKDQRFCSVECKNIGLSAIHEFVCEQCGTTFEKKNTKDRIYKFCSKSCSGKYNNTLNSKSPDLWTRTTRAGDGYVAIQTPNGSMLEHRYVMEQKLDRKLLEGENVHHIDGNRGNNAPDNLELWVTPQPTGVRPLQVVKNLIASFSKEEKAELIMDLVTSMDEEKRSTLIEQIIDCYF